MRQFSLDILVKNKLVYSSNFFTDKSPNSLMNYFTHTEEHMVMEGRAVTSLTINHKRQLIELNLLIEQDIAHIVDEINVNFVETENSKDFEYLLDGDTIVLELPEDLTDQEKIDIFRILESEPKANPVIIDSTYSYEFGASGGWEKFLVSIAATYAVRLFDEIFKYLSSSPEKQALLKTTEISDKVRRYIADNNNIHMNNLVLTEILTENDEIILTFISRHKTFTVHLDESKEVKEYVVIKNRNA